jgi:RNA polymerase sigma-70 factor (ECF subfamily)
MTFAPAADQDRKDMTRLADGRDDALNDLMQRHGPKLFHYLIRVLQNESEAGDVLQEAFVRVYQNRTKFDPQQNFSTWLYVIANNLVKDCYRHRTRHPQVSLDAENEQTGGELGEQLPDGASSPSDSLQASERAEVVRKAIAALPDELRIPLILAEYEEKQQAEIAVILNCSVKAVETRIYRARKQLKASLTKLLEAA